MVKTIIGALTLCVCLLTNTAKSEIWTLNQVLEATCRVDAGSAFGTGSCIFFKNNKYYILTNAHVVGSSTNVKLEFFKNGRKTLPIPGKVVFRKLVEQTEEDFALIEVSEKYFGKYPPRVAKLLKSDTELLYNYVKSAGCPGARWPSAWEGFIINKLSGRILFYPPPLGGQSGSGLYAIGNNENELQTYLVGMVTWRIDGGIQNKNKSSGYENSHGGAVLIETFLNSINGKVSTPTRVPNNYIPVATQIVDEKYWTGHYALGSDMRYYLMYKDSTGMWKADHPKNVKILSWGVQCDPNNGFCPIQPIPPRPEPINPDLTNPQTPDNPYENLPDFNEEAPQPEPDTELRDNFNQLVEANTKLQETIAQLTQERDKALAELKTKNEEAGNLIQSIKTLEADFANKINASDIEKQKALTQIVDLQKMLENKQKEIDEKSQALVQKSDELKNVVDSATEAIEEKEKAVSEVEEATEQKWWYGLYSLIGGAGTLSVIAAWIIKTFIDRKPLEKIEDRLDIPEDKIQKEIEKYLGPTLSANLRQKIEDEEKKAIDLTYQKLKELVELLEKKNDGQSVTIDKLDSRVAEILNSNEDILKEIANSVKVPPAHQTTQPVNVNNTVTVDVSPSGYDKNCPGMRHFRQLLRIKQRDGENPMQYALFAQLFREAVDELKKGNLYYKGDTPLMNANKTAKAIEDWVNAEFAKRHTTEMPSNLVDIELEALKGFLYKEAIEKLKYGQLNTLNAEDTAREIERWVNREYTRRLGV